MHDRELREAARRQGIKIRIVLPDPEDNTTVTELARRYGYSTEEVESRIQEAEGYFNELGGEQTNESVKITVWLLRAVPVFSFYRFDNIGILALNKHRKGRGNVPTFVCEKGGSLYEFICEEFEAMVASENELSRRSS